MSVASKASSTRSHKWLAAVKAVLRELATDVPFVAQYLRRLAGERRQNGVREYAAGHYPLAIAHFEEALRLTPYDGGLHCDLGQVYLESDNLSAAEEQFRKAINCDPNSKRGLKALGLILLTQDQYSESIYFYLRYLDLSAEDVDALTNIGVAFHNQGDFEQALRYLGRAEKLEPANVLVLYDRGNSLYALGKFEQATDTLRYALTLDLYNYNVQRLLGMALEALGKDEEAIEVYKTILAQDPNNALIHGELSRLLQQIQKYEEAAAHGLLSVEMGEQQDSPSLLESAYWNLGWIYYRMDDLARSEAYSKKAVQTNPKLFPARFNLALVLALQGRTGDAMAEYERGIADLSQGSDLKYYAIDDLADALKKRGGLPECEKLLQTLRELYNQLKRERSQRVPSAPALA